MIVSSAATPMPTAPRGALMAFTLVELLVAIAIGMIILGLSVPVLREMKRPPLTQATKDFLDACSHARMRAIMEGFSTQVVIRDGGAEIAVEAAPEGILGATNGVSAVGFSGLGNDGQEAPYFVRHIDDTDVAFESVVVNLRSFQDAPAAAIRFHPNGTADQFEGILSWRRFERRRLTVEVMTGMAHAEDLK
jgi:Tfp pilus assembly protein FimT